MSLSEKCKIALGLGLLFRSHKVHTKCTACSAIISDEILRQNLGFHPLYKGGPIPFFNFQSWKLYFLSCSRQNRGFAVNETFDGVKQTMRTVTLW